MTHNYIVTITKFHDSYKPLYGSWSELLPPISFSQREYAENYVCRYLVQFIQDHIWDGDHNLFQGYEYVLTRDLKIKRKYQFNYELLTNMVDPIRKGANINYIMDWDIHNIIVDEKIIKAKFDETQIEERSYGSDYSDDDLEN